MFFTMARDADTICVFPQRLAYISPDLLGLRADLFRDVIRRKYRHYSKHAHSISTAQPNYFFHSVQSFHNSHWSLYFGLCVPFSVKLASIVEADSAVVYGTISLFHQKSTIT